MSGLIPGVRNNGVILVGLASLPGSTQMLVVTAAGLIESQAIPSGASSWDDITGKPTEFPPSAHNHPASQITDFAEAVDDEVATLLQAGTDVSVTYNDAANTLTVGLGSNVPRLNAANTFTADLRVGTANEYVQLGSNTNSTITAWSFALGAHYQLIADSTGNGGPTIFRLGSGGSIDWQSTARADAGVTDVRILRNATGPTLETRAAGGLKVCNADGSALASVEIASGSKSSPAIRMGGSSNTGLYSSASGTSPGLGLSIGGSSFFYSSDSNGGFVIHSAWGFCWTSGQADGTPDTRITRESSGVLRIGTTSNNALGSLNLANLTASGLISCGTYTVGTLPPAAVRQIAYASDLATFVFSTTTQWRYSPSLPVGTSGFFVPAGGTAGQALVKSSAVDGAVEWATVSGGGGSATDLALANRTTTAIDVLSSTGTDITLPEATTSLAGLLNATDKTKLSTGAFTFRLDGGGAAITTGAKRVLFRVPFACTITSWELVADQTGSIVLDIWRDTYATFPPVNADSITGSAKPTLSSTNKAQSSTLTGWSTTLAAGDYIDIEVESVTAITTAVLTLNLSRA